MKFSLLATIIVLQQLCMDVAGFTTTTPTTTWTSQQTTSITTSSTSLSMGILSRLRLRNKQKSKKINKDKKKVPINGMPPMEEPSDNDDDQSPNSDADADDAAAAVVGYSRTHKDIDNIISQNREWVSEQTFKQPDYYTSSGSVHKPQYLWIGCADARVEANEIMGEDAGSVFVVRNVANMVCNTDFNLMSALQYGINVLNIPHIIVCGHYDCGGVRASMEAKDHLPPLENWLRNIRDVYRLHRKELNAIKDPEQRHRRLVELNVIEQCINLFKTGAVQRKRMETYANSDMPFSNPRIHPCIYDPKDGLLKELKVDFKKKLKELGHVYDLYNLDDDVKEQLRANKMCTSDVELRLPGGPSDL